MFTSVTSLREITGAIAQLSGEWLNFIGYGGDRRVVFQHRFRNVILNFNKCDSNRIQVFMLTI